MKRGIAALLTAGSLSIAAYGGSWPSFETLDLNGDEAISYREAGKILELEFAHADIDRSGTLSRDEYERFVSRGYRDAADAAPSPGADGSGAWIRI